MTTRDKINALIKANLQKIEDYIVLAEKYEAKAGGWEIIAGAMTLHIQGLFDNNDILALLLEMHPEEMQMPTEWHLYQARATLYPGKTDEEVREILKTQNIQQ